MIESRVETLESDVRQHADVSKMVTSTKTTHESHQEGLVVLSMKKCFTGYWKRASFCKCWPSRCFVSKKVVFLHIGKSERGFFPEKDGREGNLSYLETPPYFCQPYNVTTVLFEIIIYIWQFECSFLLWIIITIVNIC